MDRKYSTQFRLQVLEEIKEAKNLTKIANKYKLCRKQVRFWRNVYELHGLEGLEKISKKRPSIILTGDDIRAIHEAVNVTKSKTVNALAAEYIIDVQRIRKVIKEIELQGVDLVAESYDTRRSASTPRTKARASSKSSSSSKLVDSTKEQRRLDIVQQAEIEELKRLIAEKDRLIAEQEQIIAEKDKLISKKDAVIANEIKLQQQIQKKRRKKFRK